MAGCKNGWKTADKQAGEECRPVAGSCSLPRTPTASEWVWVKGHAGHPDNERADRLASDAAIAA